MIRGKKVSIRLFKEADMDEYLKCNAELAEIGEFWPIFLFPDNIMRQRFRDTGYWDTDKGGSMAIVDKDDKLIGQLNLFKGIHYTDGFEVGYRIFRPEDRGKGYMTEAVKMFVDYLFQLKPINRLQVCFDTGNLASKAVAEKCGFTIEGTLRGAVYHKGEFVDIHITSLLRNEWETQRQANKK